MIRTLHLRNYPLGNTGSLEVSCAGLMLVMWWWKSSCTAVSASHLHQAKSVAPAQLSPETKGCLPSPHKWPVSENVLEWTRSQGKLLDLETLFLLDEEGCQDMGSSADENNVSRLWREGWKQNHSANSQMASTDCSVLAPSIFVLLFCISRFQLQWPGKHFMTESWAW